MLEFLICWRTIEFVGGDLNGGDLNGVILIKYIKIFWARQKKHKNFKLYFGRLNILGWKKKKNLKLKIFWAPKKKQ